MLSHCVSLFMSSHQQQNGKSILILATVIFNFRSFLPLFYSEWQNYFAIQSILTIFHLTSLNNLILFCTFNEYRIVLLWVAREILMKKLQFQRFNCNNTWKNIQIKNLGGAWCGFNLISTCFKLSKLRIKTANDTS